MVDDVVCNSVCQLPDQKLYSPNFTSQITFKLRQTFSKNHLKTSFEAQNSSVKNLLGEDRTLFLLKNSIT